ncbi:MAG: electron transfer flavoprotein subunit beta/FixA family protein [Bacteroidales bacterium]|nr:electron transfer flavoprotein subunit beta/FixA family protein [Bacteroidales bacterium]
MNILICLSNVPDTTTKIKLVDDNKNYEKTGIQWIINPWDELALTRALELKENADAKVEKVTVITLGGKEAEPTIRKALAIGADDAIRIDAEPQDAFFVASQLAEVIKKNMYDLILCGIESSDYNGSAVGGMLAELLDIPSVSAVSMININGGEISINREIDGGKEMVSVPAPLVTVVQKGIAKEPRIASMRGIMMAKTKPLNVVPAAPVESLTEYAGFELPKPKAACKMVSPDNVKELVDLLHNEAKVI